MRDLVLSVWAGPGGLSDETSLLDGEHAGVDEAGLRTLATLVEESFVIDVHDEDIGPDRFGTISRLATYVEGKLAALETCRLGAGALWAREEPPVSGEMEIADGKGSVDAPPSGDEVRGKESRSGERDKIGSAA